MSVHQILATFRYGDAISNQAAGIARALRSAGHDSEILVETAGAGSEDLVVDYRDMLDEIGPDDAAILHFSVGSRAAQAAYALPCRLILVYHNITPAEFFVGIHDDLARLCFQGRRELAAFRTRADLALGVSEYNRQELESLGFSPTGILPVVPDFRHVSGPDDPWIRRAFDDDAANVLFVGRITPNKRQDNVIRHFAAYQRAFNPESRLLLAGTAEGFERYQMQLQSLAAALGARNVHFLGQITNDQLATLYRVSDLFLSASEHEGFCVPIVEAFHFGVPVLALARAAVPATMDGGGVLYDSTDSKDVAMLMHGVLSDDRLADRIVLAQDAALGRLESRDFAALVRDVVERVTGSPRRARPAVAPGWEAFRAAAALDDIRETRPLAYHRLPPPPPPRRRPAWLRGRP
jgi:glycosyltransferase involved in cell wall biosynthesis